MSDIVIKAENLGKLYTIGHQAANGRYVALRDVLAQNARSLWRATTDLVRGKPLILGNELEEVWALKDVSFEVRRGETVGIIGRNGAGKSTLLKVLSRITEPSAGRVTIKGRVASLLEVGTGFHPELTGRENVYLNGAILGMTRAEVKRKFDEIVAFAEIEKFLDTPVKRYSSGMYVRLAFAVAAHLEPEILLVDEVLAVGDAAFQKKCLGKMGEVAHEGRTVLFVSHDMAAIKSLCPQSILLEQGKLPVIGQTHEVIAIYLNQIRSSQVLSLKPNGMITHIETQDSSGVSKNTFDTGDPIMILLHIDTHNELIKTPVIGIGFNTSFNQRVFTVGTYFSADGLPPLYGKVLVQCNIPHLPLVPGEYYLNVALGKHYPVNSESIEHAISIQVSPSDFFGTGRLPSANQGFVVVRSSWQISN